MKKRVNKIVVVITAVLTFGALGLTAKMHHMHHHKHHAQYMQGDNMQENCFMWQGVCDTEEATVETE